ncbi:hypothetical protein BDZ91DRAFT_749478 [Kalaharituber pfeilii]|nr:hypothetical protein BDZ91DRAFT_749478 [Kalaharituber pfeilii]
MDVVICHDYGPFMLESYPQGGYITWLENPGREQLGKGHWKERYIGRWPAMHRIKAGYFTQKSALEIIAASVVWGPHNKVRPIPIIRFQSPDTHVVRDALEWQRDIIDDEHFTVIHEVTPRKFNGPDGLDSMLIASREGVTHLWYESSTRLWRRELITPGEPRRPGQTEDSESPGSGDHWGAGCMDAGRIGDDPFAYIATLDPFHGTTCTVLTKENRGISGTVGGWKRQVLDVYGTPNQLKHTGDGPGHFIVCADFDGDGDDEFLLSLFGSLDRDEAGESIPPDGGPNPNKGILYYKCMDLEKGIWAKWEISPLSSARIALGDFDNAGRIDLVSMSYNVARYYVEPKPKVTLLINDFAKIRPAIPPASITATIWENEGLIYVSNPSIPKNASAPNIDPKVHVKAPVIDIGNYSISVEVLPPKYELHVPDHTYIKVLYGAIKDGDEWRAPLSVPQFTAKSTDVKHHSITAHERYGAVILRFRAIDPHGKKYKNTQEVPVKTTLDVSKYGLTLKPLKFIKVEDLWWGSGFKGVEFYNLTGFHFRFQGSQENIAHLQFWTAGTNVNCGVHNHSDAIFQEIHICLSPGTGNGGMARLKPECVPEPPDPDVLNSLGKEAFDELPLKEMEEHGGMWERDPYGLPVRDEESGVIKYPYHKWQAGCGTQGIDVWAAIEFPVDIDYRVEGVGQTEGGKKKQVPKKGVGKKVQRTCC